MLAASSGRAGSAETAAAAADGTLSRTVGLLPVAPEAPRKLRAMTPPADGLPPFAGTIPLQSISLPATGGALGIPEIVLAAYRNAELAMESAEPGCGISWSLLAGIGRIESGHAGGGRTDAAGTTTTPIFGPSLDGTLPGNEVIKAVDGSYVRAIGPMQFLPSTWSRYASDGNGDGIADPHNVFDASLAASKYLCSGGLDLRDPAQELRAVLRYNNSMSYAANVLSWSTAYRTGGTPSQVSISPDLIPPGSTSIQAGPDMTVASTTEPTTAAELPPNTPTVTTPTQVMITIPGLPPIPCGIFCPPPPPNPCGPGTVPAQQPAPGEPARQPAGPAEVFGPGVEDPNNPGHPIDPAQAHPGQPVPPNAIACVPAPPAPEAVQPQPAPEQQPAPEIPTPAVTPEQGPAVAIEPQQQAVPTPPPGITLPFGIVIPVPAPVPAPAPAP